MHNPQVTSDRLTPLAVEVLIHAYYRHEPFPNASRPSQDATTRLINMGVLRQRVDGTYECTPKGREWVEVICTTPCPKVEAGEPPAPQGESLPVDGIIAATEKRILAKREKERLEAEAKQAAFEEKAARRLERAETLKSALAPICSKMGVTIEIVPAEVTNNGEVVVNFLGGPWDWKLSGGYLGVVHATVSTDINTYVSFHHIDTNKALENAATTPPSGKIGDDPSVLLPVFATLCAIARVDGMLPEPEEPAAGEDFPAYLADEDDERTRAFRWAAIHYLSDTGGAPTAEIYRHITAGEWTVAEAYEDMDYGTLFQEITSLAATMVNFKNS